MLALGCLGEALSVGNAHNDDCSLASNQPPIQESLPGRPSWPLRLKRCGVSEAELVSHQGGICLKTLDLLRRPCNSRVSFTGSLGCANRSTPFELLRLTLDPKSA